MEDDQIYDFLNYYDNIDLVEISKRITEFDFAQWLTIYQTILKRRAKSGNSDRFLRTLDQKFGMMFFSKNNVKSENS